MMWGIKYLLTTIFVVLNLIGKTQNTDTWKTFAESSNRMQGKLMGETYYMNSIANSNFFLQKDWVNGTIILTDGDIFPNIKLRYLARGDEIVAYNENIRTLFIVEKSTVKKVLFKVPLSNGSFAEKKFINLNSTDLAGGKSYFEELYSGKVRLLVFHQVEEVKVNPYSDNMGTMRDSEFKPDKIYYLFSNENGLNKIQRKKRSFLKLYPEHKKEIRKLLRKNKITIVREENLIQAFKVLDEAGILH